MKSNNKKRKIEVLVLSDIHLGTYGCHAKELLRYLKSIKPKIIILNGDIIDIWQFSKHFWPKSHMKIIKHLIGWISDKKEIYYIPGNHDELFRKFAHFKMGSFSIENKVVLDLNGEKAWFFHGDVFDVTIKHTKWLAKLGGKGYDLLILINTFVNYLSLLFGRGKVSLSKRIKDSVKSAVKFIDNFEQTAIDLAIDKKYNYVICGHIHQPTHKKVTTEKGCVTYLNSGDWVENLTALEYNMGEWQIYKYADAHYQTQDIHANDLDVDIIDKSSKEIFGQLVSDFNSK
ncbi:MAG: UDP-2,3-diacylglucosamine diphosphatase [Flavobacteriaceae bacterium]|nr:UDP-2,3-diacylglucosamine diphosphatase [Flavobacteriaceae bacterium]